MILAKLGRRDHTEAELLRALARKGFPEEASIAALEQARREGLVNDERFAQTLARRTARAGRRGPKRLVVTLRHKGIPTETARAAATAAFSDSEEGERNLVIFAGRLLERARAATLKERRIKVLRSLLGRGFSLSAAKAALRLAENARDD